MRQCEQKESDDTEFVSLMLVVIFKQFSVMRGRGSSDADAVVGATELELGKRGTE
jgi:hypothetical protein